MKAREIKKEMLKKYKQEILDWHRDLLRLEATEIRIRNLESNLKCYFNIEKKHSFVDNDRMAI